METLNSVVAQGDIVKAALAADCCRLLLQHASPVEEYKLKDVLFRSRWDKHGVDSVMVPLLTDYFKSGLIDIEGNGENTGRSPLEMSAVYGNLRACAAVIKFGCKLRFKSYPDYRDVLKLVDDNLSSNGGDDGTGRALIINALMSRRIASAAGGLGSEIVRDEPAKLTPRLRRAGL